MIDRAIGTRIVEWHKTKQKYIQALDAVFNSPSSQHQLNLAQLQLAVTYDLGEEGYKTKFLNIDNVFVSGRTLGINSESYLGTLHESGSPYDLALKPSVRKKKEQSAISSSLKRAIYEAEGDVSQYLSLTAQYKFLCIEDFCPFSPDPVDINYRKHLYSYFKLKSVLKDHTGSMETFFQENLSNLRKSYFPPSHYKTFENELNELFCASLLYAPFDDDSKERMQRLFGMDPSPDEIFAVEKTRDKIRTYFCDSEQSILCFLANVSRLTEEKFNPALWNALLPENVTESNLVTSVVQIVINIA